MSSPPELSTIVKPEPKSSRTAKVLFLSLGGSLSMIANIAFGMVAARYLSKQDYATIRQTFLTYEFAAPLLMLGLPAALYYFLPRAGEDQRGVLIDNITLLVCGGLLLGLAILLGGHVLLASRFDNPELNITLPWMAVYPLLMMPIAGMAAVLVFAERVRTLAIYSTLSSLLLSVAGIAAVLATQSYEVPVLVRILIPVALLPIALILMFKAVPGKWRMPRLASMNAMVRYSVPLGAATMLGTMTMQLHAIIVAALCTPEEFAVYINGAMEIPIIGIVTGSITTVIFAEMSVECAKGNKAAAHALFRKASIKAASILLPTMCFFMVVAEPFIVFLYSEEYRESIMPFMIYLLVLPARIVVYGAAMMALGLTREILVRSIFDLVINAALCWTLVNLFGYEAAALALVLTLYIWTVPFNLIKLIKGFECNWSNILPWNHLAGIFGISISGAIILGILTDIKSLAHPIYELVVAGVVYLAIIAYPLYRAGYIIVPSGVEEIIPNFLRKNRK